MKQICRRCTRSSEATMLHSRMSMLSGACYYTLSIAIVAASGFTKRKAKQIKPDECRTDRHDFQFPCIVSL